jgi:hypothetical protein
MSFAEDNPKVFVSKLNAWRGSYTQVPFRQCSRNHENDGARSITECGLTVKS